MACFRPSWIFHSLFYTSLDIPNYDLYLPVYTIACFRPLGLTKVCFRPYYNTRYKIVCFRPPLIYHSLFKTARFHLHSFKKVSLLTTCVPQLEVLEVLVAIRVVSQIQFILCLLEVVVNKRHSVWIRESSKL